MATVDDGMLICVDGQMDLLEIGSESLRIIVGSGISELSNPIR